MGTSPAPSTQRSATELPVVAVILVSVIGALGTVFAAYIISRTNRQDRVLNQIEVNVNSRLDRLLAQSAVDNAELGELRAKDHPEPQDLT